MSHPYSAAARFFAASCLAMAVTAAAQDANRWMRLFNTKDLAGWQGRIKDNYWKVTDSAGIVGTHPAGSSDMRGVNTFLFTDSTYSDFVLRLEGRMPGTFGVGYRNSGVMYRSTIKNKTDYGAVGYQLEISDRHTGGFYHEQGSELSFQGGTCVEPADHTIWRKLEIIANKSVVEHRVDGNPCFSYPTFKITAKGYIGLQLHAPGDFYVNFRNIFIRPLNDSFKIPDDNAWDSTGHQIPPGGTRIVPKAARLDPVAVLEGRALLIDARGRVLAIPAAAEASRPRGTLIIVP
ncbi:MAG TPA: DUF1080 domain-containing protein [Fibrobacteria bacterium]|nr:DUF1080 domain-containing protein [Fibrobacteria bacterium]